jgi:phosphoglucosamine mutase
MAKLFGTDGIRGVANTFPMTPELITKIGLVVGAMLRDDSTGILIGRDPRLSGPMLESALTAGLLASGKNVLLGGILPTPAIAFLTKSFKAQAGVVISASHNPSEDNGIKFFAQDGFKLSDELESELENQVLNDRLRFDRPIGPKIGRIRQIPDAGERYAEHVINSVFSDGIPNFQGVKVVVDCANGAQSSLAASVFERLKITPTIVSASPDGININLNCGTMHPESLQKRVLEEHANLGLAFDGDADRVILIDEQGKVLDGDPIMAILALNMFHNQQLKQNTLVTTVMSNLGLEVAMKNVGIQVVRTKVGDRYVVEKMREIGANLGGEQSGHIVMLEHGTTGDGLVTALSILKLLYTTGKPLSVLAACMTRFPQMLVNIPVKTKRPFEEMLGVKQAIQDAEQELGDHGRVLVRYSGTELLARVMVEAEQQETVHRIADMIAEEIRKENQ